MIVIFLTTFYGPYFNQYLQYYVGPSFDIQSKHIPIFK